MAKKVAKAMEKRDYIESIKTLINECDENSAAFIGQYQEAMQEVKDKMACKVISLNEGTVWSDWITKKTCDPDMVVSAWYGSPTTEAARIDVTAKVIQYLKAGKNVDANNKFAGRNPAFGTKELRIYLKCKRGEQANPELQKDGAYKMLAYKTAKKVWDAQRKTYTKEQFKSIMAATAQELFSSELAALADFGISQEIMGDFGSEFSGAILDSLLG